MKKYVKEPKEPLALFTQRADGVRQEKCFACGECGQVYNTKDIAQNCCKQNYCECGAEAPHYWTTCGSCRDQKMWDAAEEITEWDGPVFDESREKWFESYDEAIEYFEDIKDEEDSEAPEFLQPCKQDPFKGLNLEHAIESMTEDMFEDAYDHIEGIEELQAAVDIFNKKNEHLKSWWADPKKKIRVVMPTPQAGKE